MVSTSLTSPDASDIYTSMEALNSFGEQKRRVKVFPDFDPFKPKPSRTNPNVVFKRPSSMSSLMY